jgi:hypothetical protein
MATVVTRSGKGSPLTNTELDANFTNLNTAKAELASPTFTGIPAAPSAAADTNTTQIATTAFVIGQVATTNPLINGAVAVGTSLKFARADHVHPVDTSRAPLNSPTFTGTVTIPAGAVISGYAPLASPTFTGTVTIPAGAVISGYAPLASPTFTGVAAAVTAAVDTNTTQIATTAFVIGQAASVAPLMNSVAAIGSSTRYARQDHVHATDTSRAPINAPAFTGGISVTGRAYTVPSNPAFGATTTIDASASNVHLIGTMTGNITTLTINNPTDGQAINLRFVQDGTGGRTVALPASIRASGSLNTAANAITWLSIIYVGGASRWEGTWSQVP